MVPPIQGHNFGVWSCRSCAAFFRRTASLHQKSLSSPCQIAQKTGKYCRMVITGKYPCKVCRLEICYEKGMDTKKFQINRDLICSASKVPCSLSNFLGRPEFLLCCEPDRSTPSKSIIDVTYLLEKAEIIFQKNKIPSISTPYKFDNSLEKLTFTLESMRSKTRSRHEFKSKLELFKNVGKHHAMIYWEQAFLGAAKWFSGFPEFRQLDVEVKMAILKSSWMIWIKLENLSETAYRRKTENLDDNTYVCGQSSGMDIQDYEVDLKWFTNYSMEQMKFYLMPDFTRTWNDCVNDLINLDITNVELNYMLIQLCLRDAGKRNQGKVLEATDRLLQIQSDNLHEYYIKKLKQPHYSGRLTKMMKFNKAAEMDIRIKRERYNLAKIFDVFSVDFSHPEMFEFT